MMSRTSVITRALTQGVCVDLIEKFLSFANGEQFARLLSLALESLFVEKDEMKRKRWFINERVVKGEAGSAPEGEKII